MNHNQNLYYQYHQDHGHTTEDCRNMWDHLEQLVQDGKLSKFDVSRIAEICGIICITPVAEEVKRI